MSRIHIGGCRRIAKAGKQMDRGLLLFMSPLTTDGTLFCIQLIHSWGVVNLFT